MKKRVGAVLGIAAWCVSAQAAYVAWNITGFALDYEDRLTPFHAWIGIDTQYLKQTDPGSTIGMSNVGATFRWGARGIGGCEGSGYATMSTTDDSFHVSGTDSTNDCSLSVSVWGPGIGQTGPFDSIYDSWDRKFSAYTYMPGIQYVVYGGSHNPIFSAVQVTAAHQSVPEPSPVGLIGAGLAGLLWVRRRKDER
ncbi:hypothetical protein GCM10007320_08980 [Pseudorhodoferax aquiterrae]|uniref:Ice-binding protein C-terminal domain-containing protein n=1 Tax=Pseudorhodoferax aquiterrae TaxID=747304 RepID=A0ABQ3FWR3_9BURK|nr:PEP-CTERM sorting domain-containing protein [Pseudorhodoferax aquiterrae]GHC72830.1 hypothetical protein GCM10007320_08980 [Pseudorhodoferax aquiterrae]